MQLALAEKLAEKIIETMRPYCERVEVAGSIRRQKAKVKDIEIVAIPKYEGFIDLLNEHPRNLLYDWAMEMKAQKRIQWIMTGTSEIKDCDINPDGRYWRGLLVASQIKLDLFLSQPERWGATFLIRTGSQEFNVQMMRAAHKIGYFFANGELHDNTGNVVDLLEETEVFRVLGMDYVEPKERSGSRSPARTGRDSLCPYRGDVRFCYFRRPLRELQR